MSITISDVSNALTKVIRPFIQDNFDKNTILLDKVKRNASVTFMNDNFYAPVRSSRHGGITNLANDGNTLITGSAGISQASIGVKILTGTFDISKLVIDATKTSKGAVENQLTFQAQTLANDFAKDVNQQLMGDGIGAVGQVSGSVSTGTFTVINPDSNLDDGRSTDNYGVVNGDIRATKFIRPGQVIGIGTAGADLGTVTSVTTDASGTIGTVVVTGAPAIAANDTIYRVDGSGQGAGTSFITGIKAALGTQSSYAGITRSSQEDWTAQRNTTSEALTLSAMEDVYLAAREYSQMGDTYVILANKTLYKKYGDILTSLRRTVNETELISGWTGLEFAAGAGRVGVFLDYDVPDGAVLVLNLDTWTIAQVSDMDWLDDPQSGALVRRRDAITYQATMAWFMNLLCVAPAANGVLYQKTD
jgi:hypothetical protein